VEEAAFYATFLCHREGVPVIYDMQSSLPEQLAQHPGLRVGIVQQAPRWMERRLLMTADYVVCSAGLEDHVRATAPGVALREWHFPTAPHLVGDGHYADRYREQAGGATNVVFHGRLEHARVPELIAAADLCVAPYDPKVFMAGNLGYSTMKIPEYLSCGQRRHLALAIGRVRHFTTSCMCFMAMQQLAGPPFRLGSWRRLSLLAWGSTGRR
jgi:Glycosyl transferases group 1